MKTTRNHVFETNSSSSHVITFSSEYVGPQNEPVQLTIRGDGEYGWSCSTESDDSTLRTPEEKLDYAIVALGLYCTDPDERKSALDEICRVFSLNNVEVEFDDCFGEEYDHGTTGYIDHQSAPDSSYDCEELAKMALNDPDALYNFVFGDATVQVDNDNH